MGITALGLLQFGIGLLIVTCIFGLFYEGVVKMEITALDIAQFSRGFLVGTCIIAFIFCAVAAYQIFIKD